MEEQGYITFEKQTFMFRTGKKLVLAQYEFSGIQSFIFGQVSLASTREEIQARSEYVAKLTDEMKQWLQGMVGRNGKFRILSISSGKLICCFSSRISMDFLKDISDKLQRMIYASTKGKLEMHYATVLATVTYDRRKLISQNALSMLSLAVNQNKFHCTNILGVDMKREENLKWTFKVEQKNEEQARLGSELWMAIKFDLDNLGSFFQHMVELDKRKSASDALASVLQNAFCRIEDVVPIFVGGDDIFAITKTATYLSTISNMYQNIYDGIMNKPELQLYRKSFGISGGCALVRNDLGNVPLQYYFETSEEQLEKAKQKSGKDVLSIESFILKWPQLQVLATVFEGKREEIERGLDKNQTMALEVNVGMLRDRMFNLKLLTKEEERILYERN